MLHQKNILEVNNCLSLLYLNIRSLHRNLDSLTTLLKNLELRFSFIGITKTYSSFETHRIIPIFQVIIVTDILGYNFVHNRHLKIGQVEAGDRWRCRSIFTGQF